MKDIKSHAGFQSEVTTLALASRTDMENLLTEHGIEVASWGKDATKTGCQLWQEITDGESTLLLDTSGKLIRSVRLVSVEVHHKDVTGVLHTLYEAVQEFGDGRSRTRRTTGAVSEKLIGEENADNGATRAMQEELGFTPKGSVRFVEECEQVRNSKSYPGLTTRYHVYRYETLLTNEEYNSEGYKENGSTLVNDEPMALTTTFKWRVNSAADKS